MSASVQAVDDPALRARNRRLGLMVGGVAVGVMAAALIRFVVWGLPADREAYENIEQRRSAEGAAAANEDSVNE